MSAGQAILGSIAVGYGSIPQPLCGQLWPNLSCRTLLAFAHNLANNELPQVIGSSDIGAVGVLNAVIGGEKVVG